MKPLEILKNHFGYASFRLEQEQIIQAVIKKRDTLALMPTGGGKSLCYQIPALMFEGLTIVISPLIALMKDQVDALRVNGIAAAYLNSTQHYEEQDEILRKAKSKELKLLYLAPERLLRNESNFFKTLISFNISLIAIDEAHCISHWGHDFRPEYLLLAQLKHALPQVPVIALTATADKLTRKDIIEKLALSDPAVFVSSFNRANIRYTVEPKRGSMEKLLTFLGKRKDESGIIYCLSRSSTERLAEELVTYGFKALPYHAGLEKEQRARHQEMFLRDEVKIIVATIAFGMGIDKSNVRYVVHMDLPKNIESYYQETGRAGRDGLESEALLFFSYGDVNKLKNFAVVEGKPEQTEIALKKLDEMTKYGDLITCRRKYLLNYFDENASDHCGNCDICLTDFDFYDGTLEAQKVLSAVARLQERFGTGYVIDFLRGSHASKIQAEHKGLKTFGVGADISKEEWNVIIKEMVERGYLAKANGLYPVLQMTEKSRDVLQGNAAVKLTRAKGRIEIQETKEHYETELYTKLKGLRSELAASEDVPPYIILSDATLTELATYLPADRNECSRISGFGSVKLEKYADQFLKIVNDYCRDRNLDSRIYLKSPKRERNRVEKENETKQQTLSWFNHGYSISEIAERRGLSPSTIETHLAFYIKEGKLSIDKMISPDKLSAIREAIEKVGDGALTPVKQALGDTCTYGEIRCVMAHLEFMAYEKQR